MLLVLDTAWLKTKQYISNCMIRMFEPLEPLRVYKVIKIHNETRDATEVTTDYFKGMLNPRCNENERYEYRFTWLGTKSRMISTFSDVCSPSYTNMTLKTSNSHPLYIMSALLFNRDENVCENVIERVLKYAGPNHDFYDKELKMDWLFENDDLEIINVFLVIMYSTGKKICFKPGEYIKKKIC